jgi:hypothetical protein
MKYISSTTNIYTYFNDQKKEKRYFYAYYFRPLGFGTSKSNLLEGYSTQRSFETSTRTHTGMPQFINNEFHQGPQQFTVRYLEVLIFLMY